MISSNDLEIAKLDLVLLQQNNILADIALLKEGTMPQAANMTRVKNAVYRLEGSFECSRLIPESDEIGSDLAASTLQELIQLNEDLDQAEKREEYVAFLIQLSESGRVLDEGTAFSRILSEECLRGFHVNGLKG